MHDKHVNAAIVGLGRWGMNLHQASLGCDTLNVTRVVTRSPAKVQDYCDQHDLVLSDNFDHALHDQSVDAVMLATPHTRHFDQICAAAEAGKHVFCEKPFTLDGTEADTALSLLASHGLKVAIGHNRRFAPNTERLRQLIESGELGDIVHVDGVFSADMSRAQGRWRDSRVESPAGGMTSLGIHVVDMLIHLAGDISALQARSERILTTCAFDDSTVATLKFAGGATGVLTTLTSSPMQWRITVYGSKAWVELRDLNRLVMQPVNGDQVMEKFEGFDYPGIRSIEKMLGAFADDILDNKPYIIAPPEISHATHVLKAIIDSSQTGKLISTLGEAIPDN